MGPIGKYELQGVPTARQSEFGFGLPAAEMKMASVADDSAVSTHQVIASCR